LKNQPFIQRIVVVAILLYYKFLKEQKASRGPVVTYISLATRGLMKNEVS